MKQLFATTLLLLIYSTLFAQIQTRINSGQEEQFKSKSNSLPPVVRLPQIDIEALKKEDEVGNSNGLPPRFGKDIDVNYSLDNSGVWENAIGGRIWKLEIFSENAFSINLIIENFELSEGSELYFYNRDRSMVVGPITYEANNPRKKIATDLIRGESIILELFEPNGAKGRSTLTVKKAIHAYVDILSGSFLGFGTSADCNNDINCPVGAPWQNESDAVAMILLANNTRHCTGVLLNNTCQDFTPNLLTAFHCIDLARDGVLSGTEINNAESWLFRFQYKSPTCGGADNFTYSTYSGSTFRAGLLETDFALVELDTRPTLGSGVNYAGWSRAANAPTSSAGIHHPAGDVMKISIENNAAVSIGFLGVANTMWMVNFDDGIVEHGSSGSPLFDQNRRVVGQLFGNQGYDELLPYCVQPRGDYGRLDVSWGLDNAGNFLPGRNATNSLGVWLDPLNTGLNFTNTTELVQITGSDFLCSSSSYALTNLLPGATATWTVSPSYLFSGSSSGTGTSANLSPANSNSAGQATLTFNIVSGCNNFQIQRTIWVGKGTIGIYGAYDMPTNTVENYYATTDGSVTNYNWSVYPSGYEWIGNQGTSGITLTISYPGNYSLGLDVTNPCGVRGSEIPIYVYDPWSMFMIYPNPASDIMTVSKKSTLSLKQVDTTPFEISVFDSRGQQLAGPVSGNEDVGLDVSHLKNGFYYVHIMYKGHLIKNQIKVER